MVAGKKNIYNNFYPLKAWVTTVIVGTCLQVLTQTDIHTDGAYPGVNNSFLVELLLGIEYSIFTLAVCYGFYFALIKTRLHYLVIKAIIAFVGVCCCVATLMHKFNFNISQFSDKEYASLLASYSLPLIIGCFLLSIRTSSSEDYE